MSDDPADDAAVSAILDKAQREIEAAAREASRLEAKWDGKREKVLLRVDHHRRLPNDENEKKKNSKPRPRHIVLKKKKKLSLSGYCGLVQACDEDESWGDLLRSHQKHAQEVSVSPEALSALRSRLEALRCAAISAAVAPARAVGRKTEEAKRFDPSAASDAAYAAAIERVKAGDMPGAAAGLRDALFVEERPRAKVRIEKYLRAVEARIF